MAIEVVASRPPDPLPTEVNDKASIDSAIQDKALDVLGDNLGFGHEEDSG